MGSTVRFNDTLQITNEQGFPAELAMLDHLETPLTLESVQNKTFRFHGKPEIRNFQQSPVINFLVQNLPTPDGKDRHIYWGHITIISIIHSYSANETSGEFIIVKLFTPEEMRQAPGIIGLSPEKDYFKPTA